MNVAHAANPIAYVVSRLNANQNTGATAGTFTTLTFGIDDESVLNGFIARPTTSRFQALVAGYYRLSYSAQVTPAQQSGCDTRILKNGATVLTQFSGRTADSSNGILDNLTITRTVFDKNPLLLAANDYVELQASPTTAAACAVLANSSLSLQLLKLL